MARQVAAKNLGDPFPAAVFASCRLGFEQDFAFVFHREAAFRMRERITLHHLETAAQLGFRRLEKFAAGRHVEKQRSHFETGSARKRARLDAGDTPRFDPHPLPFSRLRRGDQLDPRHRRDRGQGFAAETEGADLLEILVGADFARGVAIESEQGIVTIHARAVIADDDAPFATRLELHLDRTGTGIERVFDQLLDHRSRALHHLTSGDLADQAVVE